MRSQQYDHEFIQLNLYSEYQCPMCRRVGNSFMPLCDDPESLSLLSTSSSSFDKTEQHSPQFQLWLADVSKLIKKKIEVYCVTHAPHTQQTWCCFDRLYTHAHQDVYKASVLFQRMKLRFSRSLSPVCLCCLALSPVCLVFLSPSHTCTSHCVKFSRAICLLLVFDPFFFFLLLWLFYIFSSSSPWSASSPTSSSQVSEQKQYDNFVSMRLSQMGPRISSTSSSSKNSSIDDFMSPRGELTPPPPISVSQSVSQVSVFTERVIKQRIDRFMFNEKLAKESSSSLGGSKSPTGPQTGSPADLIAFIMSRVRDQLSNSSSRLFSPRHSSHQSHKDWQESIVAVLVTKKKNSWEERGGKRISKIIIMNENNNNNNNNKTGEQHCLGRDRLSRPRRADCLRERRLLWWPFFYHVCGFAPEICGAPTQLAHYLLVRRAETTRFFVWDRAVEARVCYPESSTSSATCDAAVSAVFHQRWIRTCGERSAPLWGGSWSG